MNRDYVIVWMINGVKLIDCDTYTIATELYASVKNNAHKDGTELDKERLYALAQHLAALVKPHKEI